MKRYTVLIILLAIVLNFGCSKKRESHLYGRWLEETRVANPTTKRIWVFDGDQNTFSIEIYRKDTADKYIPVSVVSGEFSFKRKKFNDYITLNIPRSKSLVGGKYWVDKISRTLLTMTREEFIDSVTGNPFNRLEFTKL